MVSVRSARIDDQVFVLETVHRLASFGPPAWRRSVDVVEGEARTLRIFFDSGLKGADLLIAESGSGTPLGFIFLEEGRDYFTQELHGHIGILAVSEAAEGTGAGSALMRAADEWARRRRYSMLTLNVFEGNHHAREVYEHFGFRADTIRYLKPLV